LFIRIRAPNSSVLRFQTRYVFEPADIDRVITSRRPFGDGASLHRLSQPLRDIGNWQTRIPSRQTVRRKPDP